MTALQLARAASSCGPGPRTDDDTPNKLRLIVTELVINAQRYGQPDFALRMRVETFAVDLAVLDYGPGEPWINDLGKSAESGPGLHVADTLTDR